MIPSLLAKEVRESMKSFVRSEFAVASTFFKTESLSGGSKNIVEDFLDKEDSLVKGPWLQVFLPFREAEINEEGASVDTAYRFFTNLNSKILGSFKPYAHQEKAFQRLTGPLPASTIIATGTGSGKTECFLYPILDYCLTEQKKGVKAVIIYPMNALASDQASRLAALLQRINSQITKIPGCSRRLRAGIYTGDGTSDRRVMTKDELITSRDEMRKNPPDILLTNYKMLDYLVMRPADNGLWDNGAPDVLKYLVVDELHTFDGAQGTDLSCLIRRLKERTGRTGESELACVGTSATIGGKSGLHDLIDFASDIFATPFDRNSVITEERLSPEEFLVECGVDAAKDNLVSTFPDDLPDPDQTDEKTFLARSIEKWFGHEGKSSVSELKSKYPALAGYADEDLFPFILPKLLPRLKAFHVFLEDCKGIAEIREVAKKWVGSYAGSLSPSLRTEAEKILFLEKIIDSLTALTSAAKVAQDSDLKRIYEGKPLSSLKTRPFLHVRVQLWARELARMVATVSNKPELFSVNDIGNSKTFALPLIVCRECGHSGWGTFKEEIDGKDKASKDLRAFYNHWFSRNDSSQVLYPVTNEDFFNRHKGEIKLLDPVSRELKPALKTQWSDLSVTNDSWGFWSEEDKEPSNKPIPVWCPDLTVLTTKEAFISEERGLFSDLIANSRGSQKVRKFQNACPFCRTKGSLIIFGSTVSSLTSAGVSIINSSRYNQDPKILAFSDSVQDASQRAGFLEARGYRSSVRHAIASYPYGQESSLRMNEIMMKFPEYWYSKGKEKFVRRADSEGWDVLSIDRLAEASFIATFMPSDKQWWKEWTEFNIAAEQGTPKLLQTYDSWKDLYPLARERLCWSLLEELGEKSQQGRSLLRNGLLGLQFDSNKVTKAASDVLVKLYEELKNGSVKPSSKIKPQKEIESFITSILDRLRATGGFSEKVLAGSIGTDGTSKSPCTNILGSYSRYLKTGESFYTFNRTRYMPPHGPKMPPPTGVALTAPARDRYWPSLLPKSGKGSWYKDRALNFLNRFFISGDELTLWENSFLPDFWKIVLQALQTNGLITVAKRDDGTTYAVLNPEGFVVSESMAAVRCDECGKNHKIATGNSGFWSKMPCLSNDCNGTFELENGFKPDRTLYSGSPVRLNAKEHTGLLTADDRKRIEKSFKSNPTAPWDVNLISATPTLEMGVDIGSLSTVLQCSLAPTRSNYLQRIGRAGRTDGNSLAVTMISRDNHNLYFWADPLEMLAGEVAVPGIFLKAVAVLERQLFAFALGHWGLSNKQSQLPSYLSEVLISFESKDRNKFPYSFITWIRETEKTGALHEAFFKLFEDRPDLLSTSAKEALTHYLNGDSTLAGEKEGSDEGLYPTLVDHLTRILDDSLLSRNNWQKNVDDLKKHIDALEKLPQDESTTNLIAELTAARKEFQHLISREIREKDIYSYLTDNGLLPNYAFPEEGVQVRSVILQKRGQGSKFREPTEYSFTRSAASAIGEMVFPNRFYAFAHQLHVDQLRCDKDSFERWRICPECGHAEKEVSIGEDSDGSAAKKKETAIVCPNCGCHDWRDVGSIHTLVRMREVTVRADSEKDMITENDDRRTAAPSNKILLIEAADRSLRHKWTIRKQHISFELEYFDSIIVRELNLGTKNTEFPTEKMIAGRKVPAHGFKVCKFCGKFYGQEPRHAPICPYFDKDKGDSNLKPKESPWVEGLMLYRELRSEAIRIRLPVSDSLDAHEADVATTSMIAALTLGLRKYFKGNVQHLRTDVQILPNPQNPEERLRYLVVYDTVPGGTGYLKELGSRDSKSGKPEVMMTVLRYAWESLVHCSCNQDPQKDGCYKCLYQYSNAYQRENISRRVAEEILRRIIGLSKDDYAESVIEGSIVVPPRTCDSKSSEQLENTMCEPSVSGFESDLERLFIKKISRVPGFNLENATSPDGTEAYLLHIELNQKERASWEMLTGTTLDGPMVWRVETQQRYGRDKGVQHPSKPDFVFKPQSGRLVKDRPDLLACVFTDGWKFHKGSIKDDVLKRQSLINERYRVFSLSWEALRELSPEEKERGKTKEVDSEFSFKPNGETQEKIRNAWLGIKKKIAVKFSPAGNEELSDNPFDSINKLFEKNTTSFDWLVQWLKDPLSFGKVAFEYLLLRSLVSITTSPGTKPINEVSAKVFSNPDALLYDDATANLRLTQRSVQGGLVRESLCLDKKVFDSVFAAIEIEDKKLVKESLTKKQAQDKAKKAWNYFFEIADIYQFANRFFMVAESAQSDPVYDEGVKEIEKLDVKDIHWKELIQEISSYSDHKLALEYIISELRQMGIPYVTESFAESWVPNGSVVAYPEGLVWRKDGRTLAIFPAESLYKDVKLPPETPELLVLTEKTDHWQGKVKKFFEETATQI